MLKTQEEKLEPHEQKMLDGVHIIDWENDSWPSAQIINCGEKLKNILSVDLKLGVVKVLGGSTYRVDSPFLIEFNDGAVLRVVQFPSLELRDGDVRLKIGKDK